MTMFKQENRKTVHLLKPHRHAGRDYPTGAPLDLPESKAQWLIGLGVASKDPAPAATPTTKPKEA
jgi:hypothetical protein